MEGCTIMGLRDMASWILCRKFSTLSLLLLLGTLMAVAATYKTLRIDEDLAGGIQCEQSVNLTGTTVQRDGVPLSTQVIL